MKQLFKWVKSLFSNKKSTAKVQPKESTNTITRMVQLRDGINHLEHSYNTNLQGLEDIYNSKLVIYNKAYQEFQAVFKKYQNKLVSDAELTKEKKLLKEKESDLHDAGAVFQEVETYKAEDLKESTDEMEVLTDSYISEVANKVNQKASHLQDLKHQYLNTLTEIRTLYSDAVETEIVLNNNVHFESKISDKLNIMTESAPLAMEKLTLEHDVILMHLKKPIH